MHPDDFQRQPRGPYLFDCWHWPHRVATRLGDLVIELSTQDDDPAPPDEAMVAVAEELASFACRNGEFLLDLIFGHYRHAEENGWLEFWGVPAGLTREQVLAEVESVVPTVSRRRGRRKYQASVSVNPNWDREHKLDLSYRDGQIVAANGEPFALEDGVLRPRQ